MRVFIFVCLLFVLPPVGYASQIYQWHPDDPLTGGITPFTGEFTLNTSPFRNYEDLAFIGSGDILSFDFTAGTQHVTLADCCANGTAGLGIYRLQDQFQAFVRVVLGNFQEENWTFGTIDPLIFGEHGVTAQGRFVSGEWFIEQVAPTPEPQSVVLGVTAFLLFVWMQRRRMV